MKMKSKISLIEYQELRIDEVDKRFYKELEEIAKVSSILGFNKRGNLISLNYVGLIETKNGVLEILPKISKDDNLKASKEILIKMVKTLKNHPFKSISTANLKIEKMPLLEIFILFFLNELDELIKKGIKRDYLSIQDNQKFLKGKLLISEHIKRNFAHKERFFVEYDEYIEDILENRIIKTTLKKLNNLSLSLKLQKRIREFLFIFSGVREIYNLNELKNINLDRTKSYYKRVIDICKIFLTDSSYSLYLGKNINFSLLFDMNKLFESFVSYWFKRFYPEAKLQDKSYHLLHQGSKNFYQLRPDIVVGNKIFDTKWKIIKSFNDISGSDLYQMYAYAKKYNSKEVTLIYPKVYEVDDMEFYFEEDVKLKVSFFDLEGFEKSVMDIV
jgi:5-methylcytosine-specific restriction enzyme subunit McrC